MAKKVIKAAQSRHEASKPILSNRVGLKFAFTCWALAIIIGLALRYFAPIN